jgi:hypothetical protein
MGSIFYCVYVFVAVQIAVDPVIHFMSICFYVGFMCQPGVKDDGFFAGVGIP